MNVDDFFKEIAITKKRPIGWVLTSMNKTQNDINFFSI